MSDQGFQEKTEKATPKKKQEARDKGQVAISKEIASVSILIGGICVFFFSGMWIYLSLKATMSGFFEGLGTLRVENTTAANDLFDKVSQEILIILTPMFITVFIVGIVSNVLQVGISFSSKPIKMDFTKLDPLKGLKRMIGTRSLVEVIKSIAKMIIVGSVAYFSIDSEISEIAYLMKLEVSEILSFAGTRTLKICFNTSIALIILAIADYGFQRYQHEKEMKMSKQEVKEETRQTEGDPKVKQRIKSVQMEMVRLRMFNMVPKASLIITNPTHIAVALKFDFGKMHAPVVVAKGAGFMAEQIKKIAAAHDVPLIENKPLARLLFKTLDVGEFIPVELYQALAEILAYIYRIQGKL
jgi:flagellar biosynthesis protein FlhB